MRDLTPQEIKNAPEWATHYFIAENYGIRWSNDSGYQWRGDEFHSISHGGATRLLRDSKPVLRKAFDISEYEFSDDEISREVQATSDCVQLDMVDGSRPALLDRNDAISLAKHFKLTADELK